MIAIQNMTKVYGMGDAEVHALGGVSLEIAKGEWVAITGPSGSGKSTLMHIIGCLDSPTAGEYWLNSVEVSGMDDSQLASVRNREIGFVFQSFNLLSRVNALQQVLLPLQYQRGDKRLPRGRSCQTRARNVGTGWIGRSHAPSSHRTFRRTATARGDCPCSGTTTVHFAG
ncbi:ABC transporter ATP-binding protein [Candidatus Villigracilis proximus]|uniref:ABC transporter ATP-binding protein n=1 Tax=Candidatus Villigracilis proximus TaxID=3140683 RepID=UPI0031E5ADDB